MTGPEYYRKAEELARLAARHPESSDAPVLAQLATAHATLALAAATALTAPVRSASPETNGREWNAWQKAAGTAPQGGDAR